ncbi:hypothetical protein AR457_38175 [Streptomyces agglomeratus]|nr:hypothetical protein AR457_38175 [Streptomyces agglomeratus]
MIGSGDMRRLSPAAQEDLRLLVVAALESGRVRSYGQAAEVFGVAERSVGTWWRAFSWRATPRVVAVTARGSAGVAELAAVSVTVQSAGAAPSVPASPTRKDSRSLR